MQRCARRVVVVLSVASLATVTACVSQTAPGLSPEVDANFSEDTGTPPPCANGITGIAVACGRDAGPDATVDAGAQDTGSPDAELADTGSLDAGGDSTIPDANEPDANEHDANEYDANESDANDAAAVDAADAAPLLGALSISDGPTFDFSLQVDGTVSFHTFTVSNTGAGAATSFVPGTLTAPFAYAGGSFPGTDGSCGTSLGASSTCTINVTFTPTTPGLATGSLSLGYGNGGASTSASVAIQGTGETPAVVTISDGPGTFNYGTVPADTTTNHTFTITNTGQAAATATSLQPPGAPFTVTGTTCSSAPPSLAGGANCTVTVTFAPTAPSTTWNTSFSVNYFDGAANQSAERLIQGSGGPAQCAVDVSGNYYIRASGTAAYYNGTTYEITVGTTGVPLGPISQIFSLEYAGCALRSSDSTVWCWATFSGNNTSGELGNGTFTDSTTTFEATQVEVSALPDGGAPVYLTNVASLPTGSTTSSGGIGESGMCVIRTDKTLWCWGYTTQGSLWQTVTGSSSANLAFATQMTVPADAGVEGGPAAFQDVDQVSMGDRHACFLSAGQLYCWGNNTAGEQGTGDTTTQEYPFHVTSGLPSGLTFVSAGEDQTCVLAAGQVYCWGADTYSSNGNPYVPHQLCNSNYCQPLPVQVQVAQPDGGSYSPDGGINDFDGGYDNFPLTGVQTLYGGDGFFCTLDSSGNPYCWGEGTGSPDIVQLATPWVTGYPPSDGIPSGPVAKLSSMGGSFLATPSALRYITTTGVLVNGYPVVPQVCP